MWQREEDDHQMISLVSLKYLLVYLVELLIPLFVSTEVNFLIALWCPKTPPLSHKYFLKCNSGLTSFIAHCVRGWIYKIFDEYVQFCQLQRVERACFIGMQLCRILLPLRDQVTNTKPHSSSHSPTFYINSSQRRHLLITCVAEKLAFQNIA